MCNNSNNYTTLYTKKIELIEHLLFFAIRGELKKGLKQECKLRKIDFLILWGKIFLMRSLIEIKKV